MKNGGSAGSPSMLALKGKSHIHPEVKVISLASPSPHNSAPSATGEAVVSKREIDFDLILENVKDLNMLAGEGISQIEHTPQGARLRQQEPLPLTLYQNGIVMFDGPFRSYEEPSTQVWKWLQRN